MFMVEKTPEIYEFYNDFSASINPYCRSGASSIANADLLQARSIPNGSVRIKRMDSYVLVCM